MQTETVWSPDEVEADRQSRLAECDPTNGNPTPGSFYCHEALHMTNYLANAIDSELCDHPAILANPAWHRLALEAQQKLADLYQMIGSAHLEAGHV